ncbi:MAG: hypothetical protein ACLQU2_22840 [Candidatus Binataceae bacterium]
MSAVESMVKRCRDRLRDGNFAIKLWGYMCVAVFIIAMAVSLLGCSDTGVAPDLLSGNGPAAASPGGASLGGLPAVNSGYLVGIQIQSQGIRPYFGSY